MAMAMAEHYLEPEQPEETFGQFTSLHPLPFKNGEGSGKGSVDAEPREMPAPSDFLDYAASDQMNDLQEYLMDWADSETGSAGGFDF